MTPYAGDPTAFPTTFLVPDDGDEDEGVSFDVALEALGDRTAWLKQQVTALGPMNFMHKITNTLGLSCAKWDPTSNAWYGVGSGISNDIFVKSPGGYDNWEAATEFTGGELVSKKTQDFAVAANGDILVFNYTTSSFTSNTWHYYKKATTTWSHGGNPGITSTTTPSICYEPVSNVFVGAFNYATFSGLFQATVAAPPAFTIPGAGDPSGFAAGGVNTGVSVGADGLGNVVAVQFDAAASTIRFSISTDGGVTWSVSTSAALGFVPTNVGSPTIRFCPPVWSGKLWMVIVTATGIGSSQVFTSPDGITWTLASTQSTAGKILYGNAGLAVIGDLWMTWMYGAGPAFSIDGGVTWYSTGRNFASSGGPWWLASDGKRFLVEAIALNVWASIAVGGGF